jgi:beta-glucosidase-like glycosyl hydrolase/CubicO group peptidase (beta-lactamase class C family)
MKLIKTFLSIILILNVSIYSHAQKPSFLVDYNQKWVDSVFNSLSLDDKIGQLLMPRGNYSGKPHDVAQLEKWVSDYKIGGLVFFAADPTKQAILTNHLQSITKTPLLIGQDFEWGLGMRLDSTDRFPYAATLGAMQGNDYLLEEMGKEVGRQCNRIGVHINYAPVVDVNNNPDNPVINFRSFGEDREAVANKGLAYMKGMQSQNIITTAKHFPGHGDTDVDSHHDLPIIKHDKKRLHDIELYPFKKLITNGLSGIMTAHLNIPALDSTPNLASTFSTKIVYKLLREELKFEGLIFTDAMEMQGAVKNFPKGEALVMAILAGNDILETFMDVPTAFQAIKEAVLSGRISMKVLDFKVNKILKAKSWVGLNKHKPIIIDGLLNDLNTIKADVLNHHFAEKSITCLKNKDNLLPLADLTKKYAVISMESDSISDFSKMVSKYVIADYFYIPKNASVSLVDSILMSTKKYDFVLFSLHFIDIRSTKKYGLTDENTKIISKISSLKNVITCLHASPFILNKIPALEISNSLMIGYQQTSYIENAMAQALFGGIPTTGRLPLSFNDHFKIGMGVNLPSLQRLSYGVPEMVGLDRNILVGRIDSLASLGLIEKAYPGCVVQIAKDGRVVYSKAFGYHRYEDNQFLTENVTESNKQYYFIDDAMDNPTSLSTTLKRKAPTKIFPKGKVLIDDIYDFASLTKITTSTLAIMQLMSEGKFNLDAPLIRYYPEFSKTNKSFLTFRDMLTHRSGLKAWIPFWKDAVDTISTMQNAILKNPDLESLCIVTVKKPGFFKRLFGKKPVKTVHYLESITAHPDLWNQMLSPVSITWKPNIFSSTASPIFNVQITDKLWLNKDYKKVILNQIADSPLNKPINEGEIIPKYGYVYSDLHYYLYPEIIKNITGHSFPEYLSKTYSKLGANSLGFNPKFPLEKIVPTEYDSLFRKNLIHGLVHDEGAAMLSGISGHAGLFGNANDLMKLMQMYLQKGSYGGQKFIDSTIVSSCTSYQFLDEKNRRGIGFDKKDFDTNVKNAPSLSSNLGFGHSGYTGTFTWVDPRYNLVFVFLSNRVYPTRENNKISSLNIRTEIGNQVIKTINESKK